MNRSLLLLAAVLPIAVLKADAPGGYPGPLPRSVAQAPIALLYDLSSGRTLYAHNGDARFLPASITKAMTLLVAFDRIKAGTLKEDTVFTVTPQTARQWSGKGTTLFLQQNEQITVAQLLAGIATASANDAAVVLAESASGSVPAWTDAMNDRARQLGMNDSHFATPNGFPDGRATYVTANDLVKLARALINDHPAMYKRYINRAEIDWKGQRLTSHNPFVGQVAGGDGIKTGHTFEAGFNFLGSVQRDGRRLVVVVGGVWTAPERAQASRDLAEWGFAEWEGRLWLRPERTVGHVRVQQGTIRALPVAVPTSYLMTVPRGATGRASGEIVYAGPLVAPIPKGAKVGELRVSVDGSLPYSLPLVATEQVKRAGPLDRVVNGLLGLGR
ncbi:D-alanyl-D-alanine carboxypeptidase family protein [Novosphingobium sp.]|uniref:D-alanyl-D-alanine carboxypeptidase family protein n=1 Tax=Novosphingobium sp. TaxID=1874826 RepID=UPI0025D5B9C6|nr:D-alanyl-D-alanine carboxypeptidase family protein [Novosphingobium sp.]